MPNEVSNAVPEELELLGSFVNTLHKSIDAGTPDDEGLASPEALRSWISEHGIPPGNDLRAKDLSSAIDVQGGAAGAALGQQRARLDPAALRALRNAAEEGLIQVEIDSEGRAAARPARTGVGALFARLLAVVADSQAAGTWERIKACAAEDCQWAFYDHSRNRSRAWCTMDVAATAPRRGPTAQGGSGSSWSWGPPLLDGRLGLAQAAAGEHDSRATTPAAAAKASSDVERVAGHQAAARLDDRRERVVLRGGRDPALDQLPRARRRARSSGS